MYSLVTKEIILRRRYNHCVTTEIIETSDPNKFYIPKKSSSNYAADSVTQCMSEPTCASDLTQSELDQRENDNKKLYDNPSNMVISGDDTYSGVYRNTSNNIALDELTKMVVSGDPIAEPGEKSSGESVRLPDDNIAYAKKWIDYMKTHLRTQEMDKCQSKYE